MQTDMPNHCPHFSLLPSAFHLIASSVARATQGAADSGNGAMLLALISHRT
jgi:hypothetical protein